MGLAKGQYASKGGGRGGGGRAKRGGGAISFNSYPFDYFGSGGREGKKGERRRKGKRSTFSASFFSL